MRRPDLAKKARDASAKLRWVLPKLPILVRGQADDIAKLLDEMATALEAP